MSGGLDIKKLDGNMRDGAGSETRTDWYSPFAAPLRICGFAWPDAGRVFRRLPLNPPQPLPKAVDQLAGCSAGGQVRFRTDSRALWVRVKLDAPAYCMSHMAATGAGGVDCYSFEDGRQRFLGVAKFDAVQTAYEVPVFRDRQPLLRSLTLNLPLYRQLLSLEIGVDAGATVAEAPGFYCPAPVVTYGTSILQGGCASRPGMSWSAIVGRKLDVEMINLGFSGNGKGEPEVAEAIATVPRAGAFVLDYCANVSFDRLCETLPGFVSILRKRHPHTPVLILSNIRYACEFIFADQHEKYCRYYEYILEFVKRARSGGDAALFCHDMADALGEDFDECTVDGVHPTDLGFMRMADHVAPVLRTLLNGQTP